MRMPRLKIQGTDAIYHCIARTVGGRHLLGPIEREFLRKHFHDCARFAGIDLLTFAILANHYHVLIRVTPAVPVSDAELVERVRALLRNRVADQLAIQLRELPADSEAGAELRTKFFRQMHDVSAYMKLVNQWFTTWFNKVHESFGTVWAERFKSSIVGGTAAIQAVAAYIDLNPVRAGLCDDPMDYRFCGYSEAIVGSGPARSGLCFVMNRTNWQDAQSRYRCLLFGTAERAPERNGRRQVTVDSSEAKKVFAEGGELTLSTLLLSRIRHFSDGLVLGTEEFVRDVIKSLQSRGLLNHRRQPQRLRGPSALDPLRTVVRLRKRPVERGSRPVSATGEN